MQNKQIYASFGSYVWRNVLGMIGLSCYVLADTFFIAQGMGADGITALNLVLPVYSLVNGLGLLLGMGGATRAAILRGAGEHGAADQVFSKIVRLGLYTGFLILAAGLLAAAPLTRLLRADAAIQPLATVYIRTLLAFAPAFLLNNIYLCFVRNDDAPGLAMAGMLVGSFANVILDYLFIFPLGWGMFGAAFATGIAPLLSLAVLSRHYFGRKYQFHFHKGRAAQARLPQALALGVPAFITEFSSGLVMLLFNLIILRLSGNTGVAAYGVIANLALIVVAIFTGLAQGMQPLISNYQGAGRQAASRLVLKAGLLTALALGLLFSLTGWLGPAQIVALFNSEGSAELARIAVPGLRIYFSAFALLGLNIVAGAYFAAAGQARESFVISLLRGCLALTPAVLLLSWLGGMTGVWLSVPLAELLTLVVSGALLGRTARQSRQAAKTRTQAEPNKS